MEQDPQLQLEGLDTAQKATIKIEGHGTTERGAAYIQGLFGAETGISSAETICTIEIRLPGNEEENKAVMQKFVSKILNSNMAGVEITLS